jgi:hypothetical protein
MSLMAATIALAVSGSAAAEANAAPPAPSFCKKGNFVEQHEGHLFYYSFIGTHLSSDGRIVYYDYLVGSGARPREWVSKPCGHRDS